MGISFDFAVRKLYWLTEDRIVVVEERIAEALKTLITLKGPSAVSEVSAESAVQAEPSHEGLSHQHLL
jgi:hypothetical protein